MVVAAVAVAAMVNGACAGRHAGPRTLAGVGAVLAGGGGVTWAVEERGGRSESALLTAGFAAVAVGVAALITSGGLMAAAIACTADPDCDETEQCREIPAIQGAVPYKQCIPR